MTVIFTPKVEKNKIGVKNACFSPRFLFLNSAGTSTPARRPLLFCGIAPEAVLQTAGETDYVLARPFQNEASQAAFQCDAVLPHSGDSSGGAAAAESHILTELLLETVSALCHIINDALADLRVFSGDVYLSAAIAETRIKG